jgi:RNA polymerase sigma-70 factor (ECF subfamily)
MSWFKRAARPGRASDFEERVRPHLDRLYRLAWRFTQSAEDAEDLVQALLLKLLPQAARLAEIEQPGPWLARSLYYLYIDQVRQQRRADERLGTRVHDVDALEAVVDEVCESPEQATERERLGRRLEAALATLSPEHRALVALHDIEGHTLEELARLLEVPIGTLKSRLHRARANLRWLLSDTVESTAVAPGVRVAV